VALKVPPGVRVAVVASRFNEHVVGELLSRCVGRLGELGVEHVVFRVPGAFELPVAALAAAGSGFDAVVCLGAVIRGETFHFEVVAGECAAGIREVSVKTGVPVIFGVLTVDTEAQAAERLGTGRSAAEGAVEMLMTLGEIRGSKGVSDVFALR
jgi:6,7-dimethyl-8-ribityllumazine synthase